MIKQMWFIACEHCLIQASPSQELAGAFANAQQVGFTTVPNEHGVKVDLCANCSLRISPPFQGSAP